jgi:uncharacterized protein (TIGR03437 family)
LNAPRTVRLDGKGNLYIGDYNNNRIRQVVLSSGIITTFAGNGAVRAAGDNGPATKGAFDPNDFTIDSSGVFYIADNLNDRIRKIALDGTISTLAGSGIEGDAGDSTLATGAALDGPTGISVDSKGIVYFADYYNDRVRMVDSKTGIINGFAGTGFLGVGGDNGPAIKADLPIPLGTAIDPNGDVLILCFNTLRRVTLADGKIHTVAGNIDSIGFSGDGGLVGTATFAVPGFVASIANGDILLSDLGNFRVRRIRSNVVNTVAGTSISDNIPAGTAFLNHPLGVATDGKGGYVIADTDDNRIRAVSPTGTITNLFGNGVRGSSTGELDSPNDVLYDSSGNLFIADTGNNRILRIAAGSTTPTVVVGGNGAGFSGDGSFAVRAKLSSPTTMILDSTGALYIADTGNNRVRVVDTDGNISTLAGNGNPKFGGDNNAAKDAGLSVTGFAFDNSGGLLIADGANNRIRRVDLKTKIISTVAGSGLAGNTGDGGLATLARLNAPASIAVDSSGAIYIADTGNHLIRAIKGTNISTVAGTNDLNFNLDTGSSLGVNIDPVGLAVDFDGTLLITDSQNDRIRRMVSAKPASLTLLSGDNQSRPSGLQATIAVKVSDSGGIPVANVTVNFTVTSGSATLSSPSALTDATGVASIQVTLGPQQGAVAISAASAGLSAVTFHLTTLAPPPPTPLISSGGLAGAGLSVPAVRSLSSNGIASLFGTNFGAGPSFVKVSPADLDNGKVPMNFKGICVDVSGTKAPVFGASDTQVNFQVPRVSSGQTLSVKVLTNCGTDKETSSNVITAPAQDASPEFFYFANNADGKNPVAATDAVTGAYIASPTLFPSGFAAAQPLEYLTVYATGLGLTNPAFDAGTFFASTASTAGAPRVLLNGAALPSANVLYVGATPSSPGLYQVNIQVPADAPDGDLALVVEVAGIQSPPGGFLTVKRLAGATLPSLETTHTGRITNRKYGDRSAIDPLQRWR